MTSNAVDIGDIAANAGVRVADVIRRVAELHPGVVALRLGERELTYAQLDERSNRLAQALLASGLDQGARVAYLGRSALEVIELLCAASKVGTVIVPLNELAAVAARAQGSAGERAGAAPDRGCRLRGDRRRISWRRPPDGSACASSPASTPRPTSHG
ncbi:MAG: AMP-binding protein [Solirubrobacteraceae bacterium]